MSIQKPTSPTSGVGAALTEAQAIVQAAEQRAKELRAASELAFNQAKEEGYSAGVALAQRQISEQALRLIKDSSSISSRLSEEAARLAVAICSTVIGEHIKVDPGLVIKIARRALQQSVVGDSVTIIVHPDDKQTLLNSHELFKTLTNGARINVEDDNSIARGGCIVRTEFGEVDASIPLLIEGLAAQIGIAPQ